MIEYVVVGAILGVGYYMMMERSIPEGSNCSFIASPLTDILAFGAAIALIYRQPKDWVVVSIGVAIIVV